jgi:synaptic vesicle membrane protein VAT-1
MKQVWISRAGGPEVLEVRAAPDPEPGAGEVVIEVAAAGLNFADILARMGLYPDAPKLPAVVGYEVAGTVAAVGQGVADLAVGAKVLALTRFGGHASVVAVPREQVVELPEGLPVRDAAAIPVTYLTAWLMLVRLGNLQRGERVLIHAAAGGVGQAAVQIARWRGAEIFGTASASKHERLREAGVEHCIDYRSQDFEEVVRELTRGKGVQLVIDAVGGRSFRKSYRLLAPMGRLFMFGVSSLAPGERRSIPAALKGLAAMPRFRPIPMMNDNRGVFGVNLGHLWDEGEALIAMMADILALVRDGVLEPVIDRTFAFEEAAAAHRYLQDRKNIGKVLLTP